MHQPILYNHHLTSSCINKYFQFAVLIFTSFKKILLNLTFSRKFLTSVTMSLFFLFKYPSFPLFCFIIANQPVVSQLCPRFASMLTRLVVIWAELRQIGDKIETLTTLDHFSCLPWISQSVTKGKINSLQMLRLIFLLAHTRTPDK